MVQVADEPVGCLCREGERITPEVPLKGDDADGPHTCPNHAQGGFSAGQAGIEEAQTRHHDHDHGRGHDDVGLISAGIPLIQILYSCENVSIAKCRGF